MHKDLKYKYNNQHVEYAYIHIMYYYPGIGENRQSVLLKQLNRSNQQY